MGSAQSNQGAADFFTGFEQGFSQVPIIGSFFPGGSGGGPNLLLIGGIVVVAIIVLK